MKRDLAFDLTTDTLCVDSEKKPWFVVFNPYYEKQTNLYHLLPFPAHEFPPDSPWEDSVIVAHYGVEQIAKAAGYLSVNAYLFDMIRTAAAAQLPHRTTRGSV